MNAARPLVAVDAVRREGDEVVAGKRVRADDPYLVGHYPGAPLYPGVFLVESAVQAVGRPLAAIASARFLAVLRPGTDVTLRIAGGAVVCTTEEGRVAVLDLVLCDDPPADPPPVAVPDLPARPAADHAGLHRLLPHRHPVLLLDAVADHVPGARLRAVKAVTGSEPCFGSGGPAYPPTLLVESLVQAAAVAGGGAAADTVPVLARVADVRILGDVRPGDLLVHEVAVDRVAGGAAFTSGTTTRIRGSAAATVLRAGSVVVARRPRADLLTGLERTSTPSRAAAATVADVRADRP